MTDEPRTCSDAKPRPRQTSSAGARAARVLLWTLAAALLVFVAALAWAITIVGGGWYLLRAAVFFCVPLPLRCVLTDRRPGKR
jgi:hypothetical protein